MKKKFLRGGLAAFLFTTAIGVSFALAQVADSTESKCKAIHASLVEYPSTTQCKPEHTSCFIGVVEGNHGLRGTTYFKADSVTDPIPTSPAFRAYSGTFEYTTDKGTLVMRESGVTSATEAAVTAHQKIVEATGEFAGATGRFFVSGDNFVGTKVVTNITGEICMP
ncbi:MAG TPA: hypothetical protein VN577_18800 [Terriglobales bacterium]|nr:hypothetical protein [Terriglobales bacterium]